MAGGAQRLSIAGPSFADAASAAETSRVQLFVAFARQVGSSCLRSTQENTRCAHAERPRRRADAKIRPAFLIAAAQRATAFPVVTSPTAAPLPPWSAKQEPASS